jgi:hypothetical protein
MHDTDPAGAALGDVLARYAGAIAAPAGAIPLKRKRTR